MALSRARHATTTRNLTHDPVVLSVQHASRRRPVMLVCILMLVLSGAAWLTDEWKRWPWWPQWVQNLHPTGGKTTRQWQQERDDLQQEIDRLQLEQQIEIATRQELQRQLLALQEQLNAAELKLGFVQSKQKPNPPSSNR